MEGDYSWTVLIMSDRLLDPDTYTEIILKMYPNLLIWVKKEMDDMT